MTEYHGGRRVYYLYLLAMVVVPAIVPAAVAGARASKCKLPWSAFFVGLLGAWAGAVLAGFLCALPTGGVGIGSSHGGTELSPVGWALVMLFPVGPVPALIAGTVAAYKVAGRRLRDSRPA